MKREYRWTIAPPPAPGSVEQLAKEINVTETIARILVNRGIKTYDSAKQFFRP